CCRDRGWVSPDLRFVRSFRNLVQADGRHNGVCADRLADCDTHTATRALRVVHAQGRNREAQPDFRPDPFALCEGSRYLPRTPLGHDGSLGGTARSVTAVEPSYWRRIHAASRRRRTLGASNHALHHLVRRGSKDYARDTEHFTLLP